jgi:hypothetical protein
LEIVRRNRIRRVVSELNKIRRIQRCKIDILCNDIIGSQRNFLNQLKAMSLQIELYESLIGNADIESIFNDFIDTVQNLIGGISIAIWIGNSFETHAFYEQEYTSEQTDLIESCFNSEIADRIYKSRRCIELEELFEIGLPESDVFSKLSVAVIPLQDICHQGFILIYRSANLPIRLQEINDIAVLVPGLSRAIRSRQKATQPADRS